MTTFSSKCFFPLVTTMMMQNLTIIMSLKRHKGVISCKGGKAKINGNRKTFASDQTSD